MCCCMQSPTPPCAQQWCPTPSGPVSTRAWARPAMVALCSCDRAGPSRLAYLSSEMGPATSAVQPASGANKGSEFQASRWPGGRLPMRFGSAFEGPRREEMSERGALSQILSHRDCFRGCSSTVATDVRREVVGGLSVTSGMRGRRV